MTRHHRRRVENCVTTILELNKFLGEGQIRPEIVQQFERLKGFLQAMSEDTVDETDIGKIEEATNQLLDEIRENLQKREIDYRHQGVVN